MWIEAALFAVFVTKKRASSSCRDSIGALASSLQVWQPGIRCMAPTDRDRRYRGSFQVLTGEVVTRGRYGYMEKMSPLHSNSRIVGGHNRANLLGLSALDVGFSIFRSAVPRKLHQFRPPLVFHTWILNCRSLNLTPKEI